MNTNTSSLSEGCLRELFTHNRTENKQPTLQIIGFQQSEANQKQIIIRVSDGICFVDCTLSGNYQIRNGVICEIKNTTTVTNFKQFHVVRLVDYFSKLDQTKICRLKIIIRKMSEINASNDLFGCPQQIQQYMLNNRKIQVRQDSKKGQIRDMDYGSGKNEQCSIKIENIMDVENHYNYYPQTNPPTHPSFSHQPASAVKTMKRQVQNVSNHEQSGAGEPLTLTEILSGRDGFITGRLIRYKHARKQTKDGPMTVCYLGLIDKNYELIRIHLAGRLAMNNEKLLKQNKSYYIKGFDLVPVKNSGTQIRLKDREYKILEIHNDQFTRNLSTQYFHWDHQNEAQNEFVDVIGLIEDIEQKTNYNPNSQSQKSVVRVVLRNKYKSVRISFWTDQMKNLESFNLKSKEWIIITDVRKKQSKYYDFAFESNLIRVNDDPILFQRFRDVFPDILEDKQPKNIRDLLKFYQKNPTNSKLRNITAYFIHCIQKKIVYRFCDECKKKVQKSANQCQECGSQNLIFKYNCPLQFADSTGSIGCVLFDVIANKLLGKTANEVSQLNEQQLNEIFQPLYYRLFTITIQYRNQRFIMKSIQNMYQNQEVNITKQNLNQITQIMLSDEYWSLLKAQKVNF